MADVKKSDKEKNVKVINRQSGKPYMVTADDAAAIKANIHTRDLYTIEAKSELPELSKKIQSGSGSASTTDVPSN